MPALIGIPYAPAEVLDGVLHRVCPVCGEMCPERTDRDGEQKTNNYGQHHAAAHEGKDRQMATVTTTEQAPQKIESYVYDALRKNGEKFAELTDEQKQRALDAPKIKGGLRGKALKTWIVDGDGAIDRSIQEARAADAAREAEQRRQQPAQPRGDRQPGKRELAYPAEVREAVKVAKRIRGTSHGAAGPKQHQHVRQTIEEQLGRKAKATDLVSLSGLESPAALFSVAAGEGDRSAVKPLRDLAGRMGEDPFCKGRSLATILAAWHEQLQNA